MEFSVSHVIKAFMLEIGVSEADMPTGEKVAINKNRWVTERDFELISHWLKSKSLSVFTSSDFINEETTSFYSDLHRICTAKDSHQALSKLLQDNIKLESWRRIKQRFRRYKHRLNKGAGSVEVSEITMKQLKFLKDKHGLSTLNDVISELLNGSIKPDKKLKITGTKNN